MGEARSCHLESRRAPIKLRVQQETIEQITKDVLLICRVARLLCFNRHVSFINRMLRSLKGKLRQNSKLHQL